MDQEEEYAPGPPTTASIAAIEANQQARRSTGADPSRPFGSSCAGPVRLSPAVSVSSFSSRSTHSSVGSGGASAASQFNTGPVYRQSPR